MNTKLRGRVFKFGDNIDTDVIIPAQYCVSSDPKFLGQHAMEGLDAEFSKKAQAGDIVVGGENFGCGSSREQAPQALMGCGITAVLAKSYSRIFYRNAINIALPIVTSAVAAEEAKTGDILEIELDKGEVFNVTQNKRYKANPFPPFVREIIDAGGLVNWVKNRVQATTHP
jgi:3-isopropylmalate/(R)-2-methylmalate dehydratase small subunit